MIDTDARKRVLSLHALIMVVCAILSALGAGLVAAHPLELVNTLLVPIVGIIVFVLGLVGNVLTWESMRILMGEKT